ncbi:MAG: hypothetical protein ACNYPH_02470 [Gammaproteobacteria bacterium WSBS_2016_MAG_OTU1]
MSTIGYDSWAVDLAEVGAVYPFQGSEILMVIIGVALWIGWHVWQLKHESKEIAEDLAKAKKEGSLHNIDSY